MHSRCRTRRRRAAAFTVLVWTLAALGFGYNAWGMHYDPRWPYVCEVTRTLCEEYLILLAVPCFAAGMAYRHLLFWARRHWITATLFLIVVGHWLFPLRQ